MNRHITVGLAMVGSAALGAAAVQTLHAQTKPPAYNIAEITIKDQDGYNKEYLPLITRRLPTQAANSSSAEVRPYPMKVQHPRPASLWFNLRAWTSCKHYIIPHPIRTP